MYIVNDNKKEPELRRPERAVQAGLRSMSPVIESLCYKQVPRREDPAPGDRLAPYLAPAGQKLGSTKHYLRPLAPVGAKPYAEQPHYPCCTKRHRDSRRVLAATALPKASAEGPQLKI